MVDRQLWILIPVTEYTVEPRGVTVTTALFDPNRIGGAVQVYPVAPLRLSVATSCWQSTVEDEEIVIVGFGFTEMVCTAVFTQVPSDAVTV
jgi:hypothetical protein